MQPKLENVLKLKFCIFTARKQLEWNLRDIWFIVISPAGCLYDE